MRNNLFFLLCALYYPLKMYKSKPISLRILLIYDDITELISTVWNKDFEVSLNKTSIS